MLTGNKKENKNNSREEIEGRCDLCCSSCRESAAEAHQRSSASTALVRRVVAAVDACSRSDWFSRGMMSPTETGKMPPKNHGKRKGMKDMKRGDCRWHVRKMACLLFSLTPFITQTSAQDEETSAGVSMCAA